MTLKLLLLPLAAFGLASDITLATFDGSATSRQWRETNDPVMGGQSTGHFEVNQTAHVGVFQGEVKNVPSLKAPGFIKVQTTDSKAFPDISSCKSIVITSRARAPFAGYRLSFGTKRNFGCSFFSNGYKSKFAAPFNAENPDAFTRTEIPLSNFSDCNSDATGEPSKTCADDPSVCPDQDTLKDVKMITLWAEGALGTVDLEVQSIGATGCSAAATAATAASSSPVSVKKVQRACTAYSKIVDSTCAEDCLPSFVGLCPRDLVVKKEGLVLKDCGSRGYNVPNGTISKKAGLCGTLSFYAFINKTSGGV